MDFADANMQIARTVPEIGAHWPDFTHGLYPVSHTNPQFAVSIYSKPENKNLSIKPVYLGK